MVVATGLDKDIIFDLELGSGRKQTQQIRRKKTTKRNDT